MSNSTPVLKKTWEYDVNQIIPGDNTLVNNVPIDRRHLLMNIKRSMTNTGGHSSMTLPWTVQQSSNGDDFATSGDFWLDFDDIRWGVDSADPNTSTRSWIVLVNAALGVNLLIDCTQTGASDRADEMDVWISSDAYNVDGNLTTRPTNSGTEMQLCNRLISSGGGNWDGSNNTNVDRAYVLHVTMSDDGLETRVLITTLGTSPSCWVFGRPVNPIVAPDNNWFACLSPRSELGGNVTTRLIWNDSTTHRWYMLKNDDSEATMTVRATIADGISEKWGDGYGLTANAFDGRLPVQEFVLECSTSGWDMTVGIIADMWWGPINQSHARTWPGTRDFIQFGDVIFPWNQTVPIPSL